MPRLLFILSGRQDSNLRPPGPKPGASTKLFNWLSIPYNPIQLFRRAWIPKRDPKCCLQVQINPFSPSEGN